MSAATAKNKKQAQPALATTGRGAALYITLGIFMLTLGAAWALSLITAQDSYVLEQLRLMLLGLCGPLCPGMPALLVWGGICLMVSSRHRVSARNYFLVFALYVMALCVYTLSARVPQGGGITVSYLDFVRQSAGASYQYGQSEYTRCLNQAYIQRSTGAGGLIGMLIAYPLAHVFTRIGALLLMILLLIALLCCLFRLNPGALFRRASDFGAKHRGSLNARRQQRQEAQAQPQPQQSAPIYQEQTEAEEETPPSYYQSAPIYNAHSAKMDDQGFYPVTPDLYEERFPAQEQKRPAMVQPEWRQNNAEGTAPAQTETPKPGKFSGLLNKLKAMETASPAKAPEIEKVPLQEEMQKPAPQTPVSPMPVSQSAPVQPSQALDSEEDDDLPWEVEAPKKPEPIKQEPVPRVKVPAPKAAMEMAAEEKKEEKPYAPRHLVKDPPKEASKPIVSASAPPAPASAAPASSWAAQVSQRQKELELPQHTTQRGEPKPVYTDPVMPITGERIPITPAKEMKELEKGQRLDGTTAPTLRQSTLENVPYQAPPMRLLKEAKPVAQADAAQEDARRAQIIEGTLRSFGVESEVKQIMHGPSITRFAIQIAPGVKVSRVANTADNLALELKTQHVRVEAPIQGTNYIGIEVPNQLVSTVALREVLDSPEMRANPSPLAVALGKDIAGSPVLCDLSKMPHLLIAGATGSGKSVCINSIVCSLLYRTSPEQVRLIMIDPKQVELSVYNSIPHLLVPVVSDPKKAAGALAWVVQEMLERYGKFSAQGVRNLAGYNKANQGTDKVLPNIVVIIDEMADLMEVCRKDVEESIRRLAALARAAGIYMVLATQRPSVDVITGVIKNNIPSRIAFAVSSGTDSRTIIDINGAEKLMGKGDMLYKPTGTSARRVQGCFVSDDEVNAIAEYIGSRYQTDYDPNIVDHLENTDKDRGADEISGGRDEDASSSGGEGSFNDLLQQAIEMAVEDGQTSTSMLQRRLRVGYARAGRLIDEMEKRNIISQSEGSKPRKTLITREQYYEMMQDN